MPGQPPGSPFGCGTPGSQGHAARRGCPCFGMIMASYKQYASGTVSDYEPLKIIRVMKTTLLMLIMSFSFVWAMPSGMAQSRTYNATDESTISVRGTSTLHDWEMVSETVSSQVVFTMADQQMQGLESVSLTLQANTLESDENRLNRLAHETMDVENNPQITFQASSGNVVADGNSYTVTATGELTIAGVTREVTVEASCIEQGNQLVCTGTEEMKMTDFDMDPPRLFLGTLRTHDDVTVEFNMVYAQ